MSTYTLTVTETQARLISNACELVCRLGIGQWREAIESLPLREDIDYTRYHGDLDTIGAILSIHMIGGIDGWRSNLGIHHKEVREDAKIAWDLHQVIRHRMAWDRATAEGIVKLGEPRKWPEMMQVTYDEPRHISTEPLATIQGVTP